MNEELFLFESVSRDISAVSNELLSINKTSKEYERKAKLWDDNLFNVLERLCFYINHKYISNKLLIGFYENSIITFYEGIFKKHRPSQVKDKNLYPEFKKTYKRLKKESTKR